YKLLEWYEDGKLELYNLKTDIGQKDNLAEKDPELAKSLRAKHAAWRESTGAAMPTKNDSQPANPGGKRQRQRATDGEDE
ncbi:MAG: sulfatase, partial [Planctomycetota bacterium]|nr:sulfatase [Planctomycetota bacterium]